MSHTTLISDGSYDMTSHPPWVYPFLCLYFAGVPVPLTIIYGAVRASLKDNIIAYVMISYSLYNMCGSKSFLYKKEWGDCCVSCMCQKLINFFYLASFSMSWSITISTPPPILLHALWNYLYDLPSERYVYMFLVGFFLSMHIKFHLKMYTFIWIFEINVFSMKINSGDR